jgi:hypothetical protein
MRMTPAAAPPKIKITGIDSLFIQLFYSTPAFPALISINSIRLPSIKRAPLPYRA